MFGRKLSQSYEARLVDLKNQHSAFIVEMMGSHASRIADLHAQISDLRKLAFSQTSATRVPLVALEADAVLSQKEETIEVSDEELGRLQEEMHEADRILAGTY